MGMMEQYDESVRMKIAKWTGKDVRIVQDVHAFYQSIADMGESGQKDDVKFPLIAIYRGIPMTLPRTASTWMSVQGYATHMKDGKIGALRGIPVRLLYSIVILATKQQEILNLLEELLFLLVKNPQIEVEIPMTEMPDPKNPEEKIRRTHIASIFIDESMQDESESVQHLLQGRVFAYEIFCNIPDAHLFDSPEKKAVKLVGIDVGIKDLATGQKDIEQVYRRKKEGENDAKSQVLPDTEQPVKIPVKRNTGKSSTAKG
jgi:hypothetical protein